MGLGDRPSIRAVEGSAPEKISRMRFTAPQRHTAMYGGGPGASQARATFRDYVNRAKSYIAPRTGTRSAAYGARLQSASDAWGGVPQFQEAVNALGPNLQRYLTAQAPADETVDAREFRIGRQQRALDTLAEIAGEDLGLEDEDIRQRRLDTMRTYLQNPIQWDNRGD